MTFRHVAVLSSVANVGIQVDLGPQFSFIKLTIASGWAKEIRRTRQDKQLGQRR